MASLTELHEALVNADKAGDTAAAKQLADAIYTMRQPKPETKASNLNIRAQTPVGTAEAALSVGSGILATPLAGLAGLAGTAMSGPPGQGANWVDQVKRMLTYRPRTEVGKSIISGAGKVGELIDQFGKDYGNAFEGAGPVVQTIAETLPSAVLMGPLRKPATDIAQTASAAARTSVGEGLQSAAEGLMTSALKPTIKQHMTGDASVAANTLLKYGINPTIGGTEKLRGLLGDVNQQIADRIAASDAMIPRDKVSTYLDPVRAKFGNQVSPSADLAAIDSVASDFALRPANIPVQTAQGMKSGTYQALRGKYGEQGSASTEAQKALARGLKDEIASAVPEVVGLNATDSALIKTLSVTERRALMDLNKNPIGLASIAHSPIGFAAFMADKSALFKSLAARMINSAGRGISPAVEDIKLSPQDFARQLGQQ